MTYAATSVPTGFSLLIMAGNASELQEIASEGKKVPMIDSAMRLPIDDSVTAFNVIMGGTARSAGIYGRRSEVPPLVATPVACLALATVYE